MDDKILAAAKVAFPDNAPALKSPMARTVAGAVTRGLMGALLGAPARRRRR